LPHLEYCSVVWSSATKWDLENFNWLRTGQRGWPLDVHRELTIICMSISPGSKWKRLTSSLLVFVRGIDKLNAPSCLLELLAHSTDTHAYPTRHATRGLFTEQIMGGAQYYIEP
jgi:hypothetical protein